MSSLIVGKFPNQFAATSAFDKLMSRGLHRKQGNVRCDESVGRSAASASAPTTIKSRVSHQGDRGTHRVLRAPEVLPPPAELGYATLTVEIEDDAAVDDVLAVMQSMHASDVLVVPGEPLPGEDVQFWPDDAQGNATDVARAIDAASRGRRHLH